MDRAGGSVSSGMEPERNGTGDGTGGEGVVGVYLTFPDAASAEAIGASLVEAGLAACVHVFPAGTSIYRWEGAVVREAEVVAWAKTTADRLDALTAAVVAAHPYAVPCVVGYPSIGGAAPYLAWVRGATEGAP
jgi:periplasmic divalent cation tolerance protein